MSVLRQDSAEIIINETIKKQLVNTVESCFIWADGEEKVQAIGFDASTSRVSLLVITLSNIFHLKTVKILFTS